MRQTLAALFLAIGLVATSCGADSETTAEADATTTTTAEETTDTTEDTSTDDTESDDTETETTDADSTDDTETETETTEEDDDDRGPGGNGGMGGMQNVDPTSVTTEAELLNLIAGSTACGDGSLDLHRGHQPIEAKLIEVLGISHDEMHVRMEQQGQNLAAVADDLGVGAETLEAALIEHLTPAIDTLLDAGVITEDQAAEYAEMLAEAIEFRVYWDGEEAPLDFCTAAI